MRLPVLASRIGLRVVSSSLIESRNRFDRGSPLGGLGALSRTCWLPLFVASRTSASVPMFGARAGGGGEEEGGGRSRRD
jgi:hypothetical protein